MPSSGLSLVSSPVSSSIPDATARETALDITQSFLVEAPAGSGKTGLLIQRFLKLLASNSITNPAQVLAITFTRKATSEMLDRVLAQLASAATGAEPANSFDRGTRALASAVLARDAQLGWNLLDNPNLLNIRTIDSISSEIASALPVLSGSGGPLKPSEDEDRLHALASRRTVMLLGGSNDPLNAALQILLLHRDGNLANCEALIASMLKTRDQWGELIPLSRSELDDRFLDDVIQPRLDRALERAICRGLTKLSTAIPQPVLHELCELAAEMGHAEGYAGNPSPIALCAGKSMPSEEKAAHLEHWRALIDLLLTKEGGYRAPRGISKRNVKFDVQRQHKKKLVEIIGAIREDEDLREILCSVRTFPPAEYPREQWLVTKALFHVLSRALAELQLVFAERGQCDFAEVGLLARTALRSDSALDDLAESNGHGLQHLLVDEMQDTSSAQYEFLQLLTRRWDGYSQTVFLVGDPKQSIYLFRQARVERFARTLADSQLGDLPLTVLRLTANFRSRPALVQAFNDDFSLIFPTQPDPSQPESVAYQPASAVRTGSGKRVWHTATVPTLDPPAKREARMQQAERLRAVVEECSTNYSNRRTIAVLVRNRSHLLQVVAAFKQEPAIPYRAVEIESLAERPEILDLLALTRALLHPADRTAWLALLRSPACGLSLADLHRLAAGESEATLLELMNLHGQELSDDGIARLQPFWQVISDALKQRGRLTTSQWVSRTWHAFGYPETCTAEELANAETYFRLLDQFDPGESFDLARLQEKMTKLYAAPSVSPDAVDLITMHKAKGLEWDVVLVPALERVGRNSSGRLLSWIESNAEDMNDEEIAAGILAPIAGKGQATQDLTRWMNSVEASREAAERKRFFYVACTRAREELHLFAAPERRKDGTVSTHSKSLLHAAWPAAERWFAAPEAVLQMPKPQILERLAANAPALRYISRIPERPQPAPAAAEPEPSSRLFERPEGGFAARAFGNAMHAFLEIAAKRIADGTTFDALLLEVPQWQPRVTAVLRAAGLAPAEIARLAANVLRGLTKTLEDPEGRWVLAAHPRGASESSLASLEMAVRLDRSFGAGAKPLAPGTDHLWIVDYKTATHGPDGLEEFLAGEKMKYAGQLETYARAIAADGARVGLYYPMIPRLVWWHIDDKTDQGSLWL